MSMVKLIYNNSFDKSLDSQASVIEDPAVVTKQANTIFGVDYDALKADDDHVGIHLTALGAYERYGSNRNMDAWTKRACEDYHDTFVKHGHVFRHHRNKDPNKSIGIIKASAYNHDMDRVELFIHAHKEKCADELARLTKEGEVPFSMACLKAGTLIITTNGYRPIETIQHGDTVLTHKGNWGVVNHLSQRTADEYMRVHLRSWGRTVLEITPNHEIYAASFYDIPKESHQNSMQPLSKTFKQAHRHELHTYARWVNAGDLTDSHYMLLPIDREQATQVTREWARVLGYYVAEGSLAESVTCFTCGIDDDALRELPTLAPWTSTTITPKSNSDKAVSVLCYSTALRNEIESLCGRRGENKRVPLLIQHADADAKFNFMAAWFNGDGWQDKNGLHWSTHYRGLAIELQRLLASVNVPSACTRIDHPTDRGIVVSEDAVEYVVTISNQYSDLFSGISKAGELDICGDTKCRTFISGDYLCVPVKEVERVQATVDVYNFGVDGDESYTAYGLAVHNCKVAYDRCSICGQHRKNSKDPDQCEHIAEKFGSLMDDGRQVFTFNDEPQFFDISFVGRPADRIAWNLKVASAEDKVDSIKLAEQAGVWLPDGMAIESASALRKLELMRKIAAYETAYANIVANGARTLDERYLETLLKSADVSLDDDVVRTLRMFDPADVFTAMAKVGAVMDVRSFLKYAFGTQYGEIADAVPDTVTEVRNIFSKLAEAGECQVVCNDASFDVDTARTHNVPASVLVKVAAACGFTGPVVEERILSAVIDNKTVKIAVDKSAKIRSNENYKALVLATKYAAYKLAAVEAITEKHRDTDIETVCAGLAAQNLVSNRSI